MPRDNTIKMYARRIWRVVELVWRQPQAGQSLEGLAAIAHFSPYHFHRIYRAVMGETVNATRSRLCLQKAAVQLANGSPKDVQQLAVAVGYASSAAFVRAFRAAYGVPPGQYRRQRIAFLQSLANKELNMYQVDFRTLAQRVPVAAVMHQGSYMQIGQAFDRLLVSGGALLRPDSLWFGLYFDDPATVAEADLRSAACISVAAGQALPEGLQQQAIPAGKYAVLTHKGAYAELSAAYDWLFGAWLPQSGEQPANGPCVEKYLNSPRDTAPKDLLTEIWLPLAAC